MKIFDTKWHHVFQSEDDRGVFQLRICKDLSQLQIETKVDGDYEGNIEYIDIDKAELLAIRDFINKVIGQ